MAAGGALARIQDFLVASGLSGQEPGARAAAAAATGAAPEELEEYFGHGPLRALWEDEAVTEILVNGPDEIWYERAGALARWGGRFGGEESLRRYARRLLAAHGRKADPRSPFAEAVTAEGVRVHVAVPPVSRRGVCLSLRKPATLPWTLERLRASGGLDPSAEVLLRRFVRERRNLFVSGGTGTGKTSLLGALLGAVAPVERVLALEDVAEIRASHPHFLSLEARPANQEGEGEIPLERLLREALRMRPDRIVIGECRGPEALSLLLALNSGHGGSMGTVHASSPRDALQRLETLALLAAENLRETAVRRLIAGAIHVVVQLARAADGRRHVAAVAELKGLEGDTFLLRETRFGAPAPDAR